MGTDLKTIFFQRYATQEKFIEFADLHNRINSHEWHGRSAGSCIVKAIYSPDSFLEIHEACDFIFEIDIRDPNLRLPVTSTDGVVSGAHWSGWRVIKDDQIITIYHEFDFNDFDFGDEIDSEKAMRLIRNIRNRS